MALFEGESLARSASQINQAGVNKQDNNITGGDIDRRNTQKHFFMEETASFSRGGGRRSH